MILPARDHVHRGAPPLGARAGAAPADQIDAGWTAQLSLGFAAPAGRTVIARRRHVGPLVVQRAFHPEGPAVAHVYVLHPPGGYVAGDTLTLDVAVDAGAHALVTTPAAAKAYRSGGARTARVRQRLRVAGGATLEWFPHETIVFDGAQVALGTEVELASGARFAGWEIVCLGRPAGGERFVHGFCRQRLELLRDGRPLVVDRTHLAGGGGLLAAPHGLGGQPVMGTMLVAPLAPDAELLAALRAAVELAAPDRASVTVVGDVLVARYLGGSGERARQIFAALWSLVRPQLCGRPACPPRIWST